MKAFICDGVRTPIGRYGGGLASVRTDDLAALPIKSLMARHPDVDWAQLDEVIFGCANQAGEDNRNVARMASLLAGLPETVPGQAVNRLCASGLDAVAAAARGIASGDFDLTIAGGVESMTRAPFVMGKSNAAFSRAAEIYDTTIGWRFVNPNMQATYGTDSMPETAETVAGDYGVSRADQDAYAHRSQLRYQAAKERGFFDCEITPVTVAGRRGAVHEVRVDEHPRADITLEILGKLRGVVEPEGTVTAGNASGVNDGAAAMIVASEQAMARNGLTPLARVVATASAGVAPRIMGVGPVPAVRKVLARSGLTIDDMDVVELNEAFAAQVLASARELGIADDAPHLNANGGAIALGHPLGMSGARLALTAARQLHSGGGRYALVTMCVGVGQGVAMVLERA